MLFAGTTVVIALFGLLVVGLAATRSLAVAVSAGVLMVMLASLTLLPALLRFATDAQRRGWRVPNAREHRRGIAQ